MPVSAHAHDAISFFEHTRDEGGFEEATHRLRRGDFPVEADALAVFDWIRGEEARRYRVWQKSPEGLAIRSAEAAEKSAAAAMRSAQYTLAAALAAFLGVMAQVWVAYHPSDSSVHAGQVTSAPAASSSGSPSAGASAPK